MLRARAVLAPPLARTSAISSPKHFDPLATNAFLPKKENRSDKVDCFDHAVFCLRLFDPFIFVKNTSHIELKVH